jgi:hypothetical protein
MNTSRVTAATNSRRNGRLPDQAFNVPSTDAAQGASAMTAIRAEGAHCAILFEPAKAAGGCFGRSDHRGRGKRHRAVGACVAQDTTHPSIKRLLS